MSRFLGTAQGQIIAIAFGALVATFAVLAIIGSLSQPTRPALPPGPWPQALQITTIIKAMSAAPPASRPGIARSVSSEDVRVSLGPVEPCVDTEANYWVDTVRLLVNDNLRNRVGPLSVKNCRREAGTSDIIRVEISIDNDLVTIDSFLHEGFSQFVILTFPLLVGTSFLFLLVIALSVWTLSRINRPLHKLVNTLEKFGEDAAITPLQVSGALEVRQLVLAFNRMQERVARLIEERRRMLMAVGHDLRTPLTRLKLRIDLEPSVASRSDLLRDLELMQKMINGALAYLDDGRSDGEPFEMVDLGSLAESIALEFAEDGHDVTFVGSYGLECRCQPTAITRALGNLIENSCRYATQTSVDVGADAGFVFVDVKDNGPGIPRGERNQVLLPFTRLDPARAAEGRLGLGLSIVSDIIRRHGGELILSDVEPRGLSVRIRLPVVGDRNRSGTDAMHGAEP